MIQVRINLALDTYKTDNDRLLGWIYVPEAPAPGEAVNVNGEPYHVIERSWAVEACDNPLTAVARKEPLYCYLRVVSRFTTDTSMATRR